MNPSRFAPVRVARRLSLLRRRAACRQARPGSHTRLRSPAISLRFRSLISCFSLAAAAFVFGSIGSAQTTLTLEPDETDSDAHDTTGNLTLSIASGSAALTGILSGSGNVIKTGAGTLALSGANLYSGTTTINEGTLVAAHDSALGASTVNFSVIVDGATSTLTIPKTGPETVTLTLGTRLQNGGTLNNHGKLTTGPAYPIISQAGGMKVTNTGEIVGTGEYGVYINNSRFNYITNTGGVISAEGAVDAEIDLEMVAGTDASGWPTLTPIDAGLHLTNEDGGSIIASDYAAVYVTGGTDNRIVNTGGSLIQGSTTGVYFDTGSLRNEAGSTIKGEFNGVTVGYGAVVIPSTITNTGSGSTIEGGDYGINVTNKDAGSHTILNTAGGIIRTQGTSGQAAVLTSYTFLDWSRGSVTNEAGSLIEGRRWGIYMEIGGTVTNSGTITGALATGSQNAGIVFERPSGASVTTDGTLTNSGTINGGVRFSNLPGTITHSGTINGNITFVANQTNQITLGIGSRIDGNLSIGTSSSSRLFLEGDTGTQLYSEAVTGATTFTTGALTKRGTGTWVLDRAFTYTGATTVSAGTLTVNGSLAAGSTVSVAAGATLNGTGTISGNIVLNDGATLGSDLNVAGTITRRLDPLLFVPNANSSSISVYQGNLDGTLTLATTMTSVGSGPAFVAVRGDQAFAYVTLQNDNVVKVIDTRTLTITQTIATGANPGGLTLSPDGARLYVANRNDATVSVYIVDAVTGELASAATPTISTGTGPRRVAFSPDGMKAYVVNATSNNVSVIDVATSSVLATVTVGTQPYDLAVNPDGQRVYVTNNGADTLSVIDASDTNYDVTSITVGAGPRGIVISPNGAHYYVARVSGSTEVIMALKSADNTVIGSYNATSGTGTAGLAITPDGKTLYANNPGNTATTNGAVTKFTVAPDTGVLSSSATTATQRVPGFPALANNGQGLLASGATFVATRAGALTTSTGGAAIFTGGTLLIASDNLTFNTPITLGTGGGMFNTGTYQTTVSSLIGGSGALTKIGTGTLTLSGANTYTGGTFVHAGTLKLGHATALGGGGLTLADAATLDLGGFDLGLDELSGASTLELSSGTTLTVGSGNSDTTFGGTLSGTGGLKKTGTGHLNLTGTLTYTGDTTAAGGKLSVNVPLASDLVTIHDTATLGGTGTISGDLVAESGATVAPGNSIGTLTVSGDYTWNAGATLAFELGAGGTSDRLAIGGALVKAGSGSFAFDFGGTGTPGTYTLLTFGSQSGFSSTNFTFTRLAPSLEGSFTLSATELTLTVTAVVEEPPPDTPALVSLNALNFIYDGTPKSATVTTVPAGLSVMVTYNGGSTRPTDVGTYSVRATIIASGYTGSATGTLVIAPAVATPSIPPPTAPGGATTLTVDARGGATGLTYQWRKNGVDLPGETGPTLSFDRTQPEHVGLYTVLIRAGSLVTETTPVPLTLAFDSKIAGSGIEVLTAVRHPNGNIYDQVLLTGRAVSVKAEPGKITRVSYVDLSDDIVQVEFSGAGVLTLSLANGYTGPAAPANYHQPDVAYMKGHATVMVTGADETSNATIFSVGRMTAVNQALFDNAVDYDGIADLALVAISSADGKFGGLRLGNVSLSDVAGWTGVLARDVALHGPLYLGNLRASNAATGRLMVGAVDDARIAGGDLDQMNDAPVEVSGLRELHFADGQDSHGRTLPAQPNRARLVENGVDVTAELVRP